MKANHFSLRPAALALALVLAGCGTLEPAYQPPPVETPVKFKEGEGVWVPAAPADALQRGPWWELFGDPVLNRLAERVAVDNQNVAAAVAAFAQAQAVTREQRAGLFPEIGLQGGANRSGARGGDSSSRYQLGFGASWEPDLFGRLSMGVQRSVAGEQAAQADLAAVALASQGSLAGNYFALRQADVQRNVWLQTIAAYERTLQIARNRYAAGVTARTDVLQAETQLANARADLLSVERLRANLEHAIAVLTGQAPSNFSLAADPNWTARLPALPEEVPSTLLQRRPDVAAAERRVTQANTQIGIARAAWFPSIALTASGGLSAARLGDLFNVSSLVWALGASLAQGIFDGGARNARSDEAWAAHAAAAARYRQTVLSAFQDVEDQLVGLRVLQQQQVLRQEASRAADLTEQQTLNRYQAGQVNYIEVVVAQVSAANARRNAALAQVDRQVAAVALIQALGGGWRGL